VRIAVCDDASGSPRGLAAGLSAIDDEDGVSVATEIEREGESDDAAANDDEV
jgi:hypothetical protein